LDKENQNIGKTQEEKKEINPEELKEEVIKVLRMCYDPEIPVNIYDLGLIYDIKLATNGDVLVIMTLTSPACPVAGSLPIEVQEKLREHPMIHDARVEITFDPPWGLDKMSEEAKLELGFL
jgi:FeS assembly SUF system protein